MIALVLMVVWIFLGRKLGWFLSKTLFYRVPTVVSGLLCIGWGLFAAVVTGRLIHWQQIGWIIKVILYGAGAYVAIPNYGLFNESSIPDDVLIKHLTIKLASLIAFIGFSVVLAFYVSSYE